MARGAVIHLKYSIYYKAITVINKDTDGSSVQAWDALRRLRKCLPSVLRVTFEARYTVNTKRGNVAHVPRHCRNPYHFKRRFTAHHYSQGLQIQFETRDGYYRITLLWSLVYLKTLYRLQRLFSVRGAEYELIRNGGRGYLRFICNL